jgi:hypothetical protein
MWRPWLLLQLVQNGLSLVVVLASEPGLYSAYELMVRITGAAVGQEQRCSYTVRLHGGAVIQCGLQCGFTVQFTVQFYGAVVRCGF